MVAIQALTDFTKRIRMSGYQVNLDIQAVSDNILVSVTDQNALVLQARDVRGIPYCFLWSLH